MKKIFVTMMALSLLFLLNSNSVPVKEFKGTITYKISYPDVNDMPDEMKAYLPKIMTTSFKGAMSRTEMSMGMGKTICHPCSRP